MNRRTSICANPTTPRRWGSNHASVFATLAGVMVVLLGGPAIAADDGLDAIAGRALFRRNWVPAPASVDGADGLGPLFNARSCVACHPAAGAAPIKRQTDGSVVIGGGAVRVAGPGGATHPWYGRQLQTEAVPGLKPEARVRLTARHPAHLPSSTSSCLALHSVTGSARASVSPRLCMDAESWTTSTKPRFKRWQIRTAISRAASKGAPA